MQRTSQVRSPATVVFAQGASFVQAPGSPIAVARGPENVVLGDVNQDGKPDLVVASGRDRTITMLLGQGNGRFRTARGSPVKVRDEPSEMVLGDLNGDVKPDLAIASHDSYGAMLLLGDGNGGFVPAPNSPIIMKEGGHPHTHGLEAGDLNGDAKLDLVTVNHTDNDVSVAFGDGRGGFTRAPGSPFAAESPHPLALGDLNGDSHLDIVVTSVARRALTVLFGDGRGSFRHGQVALQVAAPGLVTIGDVNNDRKLDLVVTHLERSELTILGGDGRGGFAETTGSPFDLGHAAWGVAVADVNRDGNADVIAAAGDGVRVMLGDGRGSFRPAAGSPFFTGKGAWRLAIGDVNGDGKSDVATSNLESDSVTVLLAQ
ncbi:MAG TPA: VCBS repeat-containing protein [Vicinamibacterales bacterium]|nr:VCBS repeat-containing protein [Vicinamibacterales bacterium]